MTHLFTPHCAVLLPLLLLRSSLTFLHFFWALVSGKVGVSGEVEGMVIQVSGAAQPEQ